MNWFMWVFYYGFIWIAGDSRGLGPMTQRCSVLNVPPICWAQWVNLLHYVLQKYRFQAMWQTTQEE